MRQSLQFRLSLWLSIVIVGVALAAAAFSFFSAFDEAIELQDEQLRQLGAFISHHHLTPASESALPGSDHDAERRVVVQPLPRLGEAHVAASKASEPPRDLDGLPTTIGDGLQTATVGGQPWRLLVVGTEPDGRYAVGQQTRVRDEIARDSALRTALPLFLLVPILLLVIAVLVRRIFRPIRSMAAELDRRSVEDLGAVADARMPTEIRPFVTAINRLLARVGQSMQAQQRFIADAAHELRTPLTALTLQVERAEAAPSPAETVERLATLRQGLHRTRLLLDQLLNLARAQAPAGVAAEPVSIQPIVRQVLEELMPLADAKRIDLGVVSTSDGWIAASEVDLKTLIKNLLENAIRYSSEDGKVDLAVLQDDGRVVLLIEDTGPGIAEAERDRVFDPFYRVLGSGQPGSGLGLSIVQAIATRIGAQVSLSGSRIPGSASGLSVTVVFPPSQQAS